MLISIAACADQNGKDDPDNPDFEEGIPTEVRITLSARSGNAQTRADEKKEPDGTPKDPTSTIELIHNWWIVFIDNSKKIVKIIKDTDTAPVVYDKTPSTSVNLTGGGYEAETFRTVIPSGTYRIYAFANIPFDEEIYKSIFGDSYKFKGGQLKNVYINDFVPDAYTHNINEENNGMQWPASYKNAADVEVENYIPMTQILKDKVISNTVEEAFNIEVVRTVAKVEFAFSNPTSDDIRIKELKFGPISKGERISIVPNNDSIGYYYNNKIYNDVTSKGDTATLKFSNLSLIKDRSEDNYMGKFDFYCKESLPSRNGGPFTITLTVDKGGMELKRVLKTSKIQYINRNDWIYIPISFADWKIYWKLHYYPPIGGYPPVFQQNADGSSMSATLTTGGEFELYPYKIMNGTTEIPVSSIDWGKVEVADPVGYNLFVTGKAPALIANPGNTGSHPVQTDQIIAGELDPKEIGTATVSITFELKDNDYIGSVFTCTFTITRQNESLTPPTTSDP